MGMKFTKMQGIGNDYVYVNGFEQKVADPAEVARKVADRHFGIGGDGLILILPSKVADVRMQMFNADGSEGEMCGNGVRCVAKFAYDHGLSKSNPMKVETGRGVLTLDLTLAKGKVEQVTVNMGEPILDLKNIPVDSKKLKSFDEHQWEVPLDHPKRKQLELPSEYLATFVSMGNPHAVIYVPDVAKLELEHAGPIVENHLAF